MLARLIRECRCLQKFAVNSKAVKGTITISGGEIGLQLPIMQYVYIEGSAYNNGIRQNGLLRDETFTGTATPLAIDQEFIELAERIREWNEKNATPSAFQSESFDGYSYTRAAGKDGGQITWQDAFRKELRQRRMI